MKLEYEVKLKITEMSMIRYNTIRYKMLIFRVLSKLKVQNSSTFQGLSRTQIAFVKHQNYRHKAIS